MATMHPHVKVIDCTIRDGGLCNNWDFTEDFVADVYRSLSAAHVDYMEIGYKNSLALVKRDDYGPWHFLDEALVEKVTTPRANIKVSALVDIGRTDEHDILPRAESRIDMIRVACYVRDVDRAVGLATKFHDLGYETSVNIMAVSTAKESDLNGALEELNESPVDIVYVVDSFGSLVPDDVKYLIDKYHHYVHTKKLGIHTHNNMQLAFSNTLLAMNAGIEYLDSSIYGMGRAAGNCPTELLLAYLGSSSYDIVPILDVLARRFVPLREQIEWGYTIPYMLTGAFNEHPRIAMAARGGDEKDNYVGFYETMTSVETHQHHM